MDTFCSSHNVLSLAGCDPSAFAGFTADLRTFGSLGVHGLSVATALTVQSPKSFDSCSPVAPSIVVKQIESVYDCFGPMPCKIGLIPDKSCLQSVSYVLGPSPMVLDPILGASAGQGLSFLEPLDLAKGLFPKASLVTPNIPEAEAFVDRQIHSIEDMVAAATLIHDRYGCWVLLKGGHLEGSDTASDVLYNGADPILFEVPRVPVGSVHGSGCFLSASITGHLALGFDLLTSIQMAKEHISAAFADPVDVGGYPLLDIAP